MSMYQREHGKPYTPEYDDGLTKQSFKDSCDINKMLKKAQTAGSLSHLMKYPEATYGEFDGEFNLLEATEKIAKANEIFNELPSEVRSEFQNNALNFVNFANDPANVGRLQELLPAIAAPGQYFPNPVQRGGQGAGAATAPADVSPASTPDTPSPASPDGGVPDAQGATPEA